MTEPGAEMGPPGRILIVDDEPLNVDYLEQELECQGYVTESAANGLEALERVAASPPDLVLLDVMMPELDGIATLRILKADPETRLIPVVLMTALNAVEDRVRGIEAGADDFLSKPVDDRELMARIRTAISRKRAVDETLGELRSTSSYLERFGRQERQVAVLAVEWRLKDSGVPDEAIGFMGRRERTAAEELIGAHGGLLSERDQEPGLLVAVFDGPDLPSRVTASVEAGLAVVAAGSSPADGSVISRVAVSAAIASGVAVVGSSRMGQGSELRWVWGAEGAPVELASTLARHATTGAVAVSGDVAAAAGDRFALTPAGREVFHIEHAAADEEHAERPAASRRITTILVTEIVGSTSTLERLGDDAGGQVLAAHEAATRAELVLHGGEEINAVGDGFLATFDSPARAIRCAFAVLRRVRELGLVTRAGVHTGELETVEGVERGLALHVASRIGAQAAAGEVLVSATTRELAEGAGLSFVDRGEHRLRGLSDPRQLFAAFEERSEPAPSARAGGSAAHATSFPAGLTAREVDVLRLVAMGRSDAQVAGQLYLSVRTVNAHLRSIYRKAGARSRAEASRFADENGLL